MKKLWCCLAACVAAAGIAAAVYFGLRMHDAGRSAGGQSNAASSEAAKSGGADARELDRKHAGGRALRKRTAPKSAADKRQAGPSGGSGPVLAAGRRNDKPEIELDDDDLSPAERTLKDAIEKALDDEDLAAARKLAAQAMIANNQEIRQAMVDTLGWFGVKALPELTPFLADPDEDVRESAMNEWSMAISEIEDDAEKLGLVELAMHVLNDEDSLEDISGEYIGADEKIAVESLLRVIEAGGSENGIAKAKETYEFVTGDEFTDRAAAEKWIAEEYEPPEAE